MREVLLLRATGLLWYNLIVLKQVLIAAGFLIVGVAGTVAYMSTTKALPPKEENAVACTMDARICPDGSAVGRVGPKCQFADCPVTPVVKVRSDVAWKFKDKGESTTGAPRTEVTLATNGKSYVVGTYDGSCAVVDGQSWKLLSNERSGVICWFAGGGVEIGVFEEGGGFVVKQGSLDEGDAENAGLRGGFKALFNL